MEKLELTYAEIEQLQYVVNNYMQEGKFLTRQDKDMLEKLAYKLIAIRSQKEYLKRK
jgi:hypothetical protein